MSEKVKEEKQPKRIKCYYCGEHVHEDNVTTYKVPVISKKAPRKLTRKFHFDCLKTFLKENDDLEKKQIEYTEWEQVYYYFQYHILNLDTAKSLDDYAVKRLLGLRVGQFMPNSNVRVVKTGHSYRTILNTMKYSKRAIDNAFATVNIKDPEHKVNLAISIIRKNLNFIDQRMKAIDKQNKRTEQIEVKEIKRAEYVRKGDRKGKKALFAALFDED